MKSNLFIRLMLLLGWVLLIPMVSFAQDGQPEMADAMRAEGKIYVVVAVAMVVLSGILIYLIRLEKKVSQLEKKLSADQKNK